MCILIHTYNKSSNVNNVNRDETTFIITTIESLKYWVRTVFSGQPIFYLWKSCNATTTKFTFFIFFFFLYIPYKDIFLSFMLSHTLGSILASLIEVHIHIIKISVCTKERHEN